MPTDRRTFIALLGAIAATPPLAPAEEAKGMHGLISKLTVIPGKRDEMIAMFRQIAQGMPGCFSYIVAKDAADENVLWITEAWQSTATHDASLSLPGVKKVMAQAKPMLVNFERIATTTPVLGIRPATVYAE